MSPPNHDPGKGVEIIAIRHGETPWNLAGRIQGHLDSGLTALGLRQAEALAASFAGERLDAIHASDLPRALGTAEAIARAAGCPVVPDPRLRERHHGIFQGLTLAEAARRFPEDHAAYIGRGDLDRRIPAARASGTGTGGPSSSSPRPPAPEEAGGSPW